jgi:HTH-type transcriptional regulator / antitoxin MqsA
MEPGEIRRIRLKLPMSQQKAGLIIGGGPRAFQKYERGDLLSSHGTVSALVLLDYNPEGLRVLEERMHSVHSSAPDVPMRKDKRSRSYGKGTPAA